MADYSVAKREEASDWMADYPGFGEMRWYSDALGTEQFATHKLPLEQAPEAYATFQKKEDGMVKVVLKP